MLGGDSAYGMVEPFGLGETRRAPRTPATTSTRARTIRGFAQNPERCELWKCFRANYETRVGNQGVGRDGFTGEVPDFAPAAKYEDNPFNLQGARVIGLMKGRQTHFVAESILQRTREDDEVDIYAYSLDHPLVIGKVIEAARRGTKVRIYMDRRYLLGDQMSKSGARLLIDAMDEVARARSRGSLRIFAVEGRRAQDMYGRYEKRVSEDLYGSLHAKVMYCYPYLIFGSTNWSISSEANKELSVLLEIEDDETREYVEDELDELQLGKQECFRIHLAQALETGGRGVRGVGSTTTTRSRR